MSIRNLKKKVGSRHLLVLYIPDDVRNFIKELSERSEMPQMETAYKLLIMGAQEMIKKISAVEEAKEKLAKEQAEQTVAPEAIVELPENQEGA